MSTPISYCRAVKAFDEIESTREPNARQQQPVIGTVVVPWDEETEWILGRPNYWCAHVASALRKMGRQIREHAEEEQAAAIYWMLQMYARHGERWRIVAAARLRGVRAMPEREMSAEEQTEDVTRLLDAGAAADGLESR
jgi:hypothetical protein